MTLKMRIQTGSREKTSVEASQVVLLSAGVVSGVRLLL